MKFFHSEIFSLTMISPLLAHDKASSLSDSISPKLEKTSAPSSPAGENDVQNPKDPSRSTRSAVYTPREMEQLLSYLTKLARAMMANGATIEHTEIAVQKNAEAYRIQGLSYLILNNYVSVCFHDSEGKTYMKQLTISSSSINLEKLRLLNDVSYRVCRDTPPAAELGDILRETKRSADYRPAAIVLCQMLAISCICFILGGGIRDMLGTAVVTFALFWIQRFLSSFRSDQIINNVISMFAATVLAYFLTGIGLTADVSWMLISVSLLMIPGIPLVNAFRNLICGNELNGIVQLIRVLLESMTLALGTFLGVLLMGGASAW